MFLRSSIININDREIGRFSLAFRRVMLDFNCRLRYCLFNDTEVQYEDKNHPHGRQLAIRNDRQNKILRTGV